MQALISACRPSETKNRQWAKFTMGRAALTRPPPAKSLTAADRPFPGRQPSRQGGPASLLEWRQPGKPAKAGKKLPAISGVDFLELLKSGVCGMFALLAAGEVSSARSGRPLAGRQSTIGQEATAFGGRLFRKRPVKWAAAQPPRGFEASYFGTSGLRDFGTSRVRGRRPAPPNRSAPQAQQDRRRAFSRLRAFLVGAPEQRSGKARRLYLVLIISNGLRPAFWSLWLGFWMRAPRFSSGLRSPADRREGRPGRPHQAGLSGRRGPALRPRSIKGPLQNKRY